MTRCSVCPEKHKCVPPNGYVDSRIILVGEAPGYEENDKGIPFVGRTGRELDGHYLPLGGLRRPGVIITNAIGCLPDRAGGKIDLNHAADKELLETCSKHHLIPMLQEGGYSLIVLMGAFACYAVDPSINLELQHGMPVHTKYGVAFPMYHPAAGLHEPKKMLMIRNDWIRLKKYIKQTLKIAKDEHSKPEYAEITSSHELDGTLEDRVHLPIASDTESMRTKEAYCLSYSVQPGSGYVIRADRYDLLKRYQSWLCRWEGHIWFHHLTHDAAVYKQMDLKLPLKKCKDTLVLAHILGNIPQGLKALAYRELGIQMDDFEDVVMPYSREIAFAYLREAWAQEEPWPIPAIQEVRQADGTMKPYKAQGFRTKLKRFWTEVAKNPYKDPFDALKNWEAERSMVEERCGPFPGMCISHVPFDVVVKYAGRDADATLRLSKVIQHMTSRVRKTPQEHWRD